MKGEQIIETKHNRENDPTTSVSDANPEKGNSSTEMPKRQEEAVSFVEENRDFFEHYAKGRIKIEPAPSNIKTFAFDLKNNTIYINSTFYGPLGLSKQKTIFATLHEIEHFLEKIQILSEKGGEKRFAKYLERIKSSKAFSIADNCVADVRENRAVIANTTGDSGAMKELETQIYKEHLFPGTDFTSDPKHLQLGQAFLREARVPNEKCIVHEDVRKALDEINAIPNLVDVMTDPLTPMSTRLRLQDKYIMPKVEELLKQDVEDRKKKKQEEKDKKEKSKDGEENTDKGSGGDGEDEGENEGNESSEDGSERNEENKDGNKSDKGDEGGGEDSGQNRESEGENSAGNEAGNGGQEGENNDVGEGETDPNKIFADDYARIEKKFPEAVPIEEIEKAFKEWKEKQGERSERDKVDEEHAKKIGVDKADLQNYRRIVKEIENIVNPETNVNLIEELKNLFSRIIAKRLKIAPTPKYPVEEGDELVEPGQLVAEVRSGVLNPKVWEDIEIKEKRGDRFGEVEITLVCDRSNSMMQGNKAEEQRRSAVLVMEVLKEFAEMCEEEKMKIEKPLEIRSEIYGFGAGEDNISMKKMSTELGEAERVNVAKKLHNLPGSTTDFVSLEAIYSGISDDSRRKMKEGELKKIVIVFTDGESDNSAKVQAEIKKLNEAGVVVIGVGMTSAGTSVLTTYAPNAMVVQDVSKLPLTVGDLLKEHLKSL